MLYRTPDFRRKQRAVWIPWCQEGSAALDIDTCSEIIFLQISAFINQNEEAIRSRALLAPVKTPHLSVNKEPNSLSELSFHTILVSGMECPL